MAESPRAAAWTETPVGPLAVVVDPDGAVLRMDFAHPGESPGGAVWRGLAVDWRPSEAPTAALAAVADYFAGRLRRFTLTLRPSGGGDFDRAIWHAMPDLVPFGATVTYGELAARMGRPGAARAVGHANATNPISLIMPCHRVLGAGGKLVGYGGGEGVATKRALIAHEAAVLGLALV
jgi:methylated-DNA-[protein]-cysteine S-methyltransferase